MIGHAPERLHVEGVSESWFRPAGPEGGARAYRPAALVECRVNFRSLRAGLNHSEERSYTAWLPEGDLAIDWDSPAATFTEHAQVAAQPDADIPYLAGNYQTTKADFEQYEAELIDILARKERLRVFFNPVFGLFSGPNDALEDFLARVAEAALTRVEPEMKRLRARFELQMEQVREAHARKGRRAEELDLESVLSHKLRFFESENRLAGMFSTLAGSVFGASEARPDGDEDHPPNETELREDLGRLEQEASEALGALYGEYRALASEYDIFEIGLRPDNVQVIRRALLWVPIERP